MVFTTDIFTLSLMLFSLEFVINESEVIPVDKHHVIERATITGCVVPASTKERSFVVYDSNEKVIKAESGTVVPKLISTLVTNCSRQYVFDDGSNTAESFCNKHGQWTPSIKTCRRTCTTPKSDTLNIKCKRNKQDVPCTGLIFDGTRALLSCKPLSHPENPQNYFYTECKSNGEWDKPFFKCVPDCGQTKQIRGLIQHGSPANLGDFPWHVAIYRTTRNNTLICGGTLISKTSVISAAHCFFNEELGVSTANQSQEYEVIVAKVTTNYSIMDNKYQQKFKVKKIIQHENEYNPSLTGHYGSDIIILKLEKPVVISQYVLPACVAWGDRVGFNPGRNISGVVAGWGLDETDMPSDRLQYALLPYISYNECSKKIRGVTNDKFCAGSSKGAKPSLGDSGGGLVFRNSDNLFYLRGIVSTEDSYNNLSVVTFTDVSNFKEWIQRNFEDASVSAAKTKYVPSVIVDVPSNTVSTLPPKPKPCPSLHPPFTDVKCYAKHSNMSISCDGEQPPGTKIVQRCISFYHAKDKDNIRTDLTCKDNGEWDGPPLKCVVDCGYPISSTTTLVFDGKPAVFGDHPWAVAIYKLLPKGDDATLICGGTIISPTLILSAASCFYNKTEKKVSTTVSDYEIIVSKFSKDYKKIDSGIQKKYKVKDLVYNNRPTYNPAITGVHAGDIVVVVPEKPIQINRFVLPACVAWNEISGSFEPPSGALIGIMAGWGPSGTSDTNSDILLTADLPFISYVSCLGKVGQLTGDKFCAGDDKTSEGKARGVDSGAGILFLDPREGLYYLRGVSTVYEENINSSISLFTDIQFFLPWMKRLGSQSRIIVI